MAYRLITPPTLLPVARGEAKAHIILDHNCDDSLIDGLILAAKEKVESDTRRQLVTATWEFSLDKFPVCDGGIVYLEKPPIQSVSFVKYIDGDGVLQTLDASNYQLDSVSEPGRLKPAYGYSWPSHRCQLN